MLVIWTEIWQFDAMEAMAESILLDRKYQLLTWLYLVFPNYLITRLRQHLMWMIAILLLCFGSPAAAMASTAGEEVVVFRSAYCECCEAWESHIAEAGFVVQDHVADDMDGIKEAMGVPADSASCHTARVSGYVVEGHVPAASIQRMLKERPEIKGLAAPGMPMGSPGMEVDGMVADPFSVFSIANNGTMVEIDFYGSH
ncbi:metal-binding protein-like [Synechococcus sp. BL107]|uniref:DUF411 domain-containing protein n=1 Tax=Synechococcus sp. BL107 TaxID=313625 RepID=UPI0000E54696|nr:DUF411 domain-containing protein [Synechococcus sp. BL107]EAU70782.1 metal-binding protein-like [Synechococcus sp. BL107]